LLYNVSMKRNIGSKLFVLALVALTMIGCTASQLTVALDVVSDAAAAAAVTAPLLAASGVIPVPVATLIVDYTGDVSAAVVKVDAELASSDSNAIKASSIIADFAAIVVPNIPGAPANAVALVNGIANAVAAFITQVQQQLGTTTSGISSNAISSFNKKTANWKPSYGDRQKLKKSVATAKDTLTKVAAWKAAHK
jgi:hypothetical protein